MTPPNSDPGYWFRRLDEKLDAIDAKLDDHNTTIATHGLRISNLESGVDKIHADRTDEKKTLSAARQALLSGIVAALISGVFQILPFLIH